MITKAKTVKLPVVIKPGEDGFFVVEVPILPGCISQGKTKDEALANIKEAAKLYIDTVGLAKCEIPKKCIVQDIEVDI
jgi:predicted RNase H-like HicB family nuclease